MEPRWPRPLIAAIVAAILLLGGSSKKVQVPSVKGMTEQAAGADTSHAGLNPVPSFAASSTVKSGLVVSQTPPAGDTVSKGTQVTIVVSGRARQRGGRGRRRAHLLQALERLKKAGFKPTTKPQASSTVPEGRVIGTNPPAGTEIQLGSPVTVFVSSGPEPVKVPDVKGQSAVDRRRRTEERRAEGGNRSPSGSMAGQTAETVLSQSPGSGKSVKAGSSVALTVAEAPTEVVIPSVIGESQAPAEATLKKAGFKIKTVTQTTSEASQVGMVLRQSPTAATEAPKGSTITLALGVLSTPTTNTTTTPTTPTPPPGN